SAGCSISLTPPPAKLLNSPDPGCSIPLTLTRVRVLNYHDPRQATLGRLVEQHGHAVEVADIEERLRKLEREMKK
ncbi:MAG: hypothetical protein AB1568_15620, partial [Thermodesulfobacteriota bacterium]